MFASGDSLGASNLFTVAIFVPSAFRLVADRVDATETLETKRGEDTNPRLFNI